MVLIGRTQQETPNDNSVCNVVKQSEMVYCSKFKAPISGAKSEEHRSIFSKILFIQYFTVLVANLVMPSHF